MGIYVNPNNKNFQKVLHWKPEGKTAPFLRLYELPEGKRLITGRNISGAAFAGLTAEECVEGVGYLNA